jgi:hypothetical protein
VRLIGLIVFVAAALAAPASALGAEPPPDFCERKIVDPAIPWSSWQEPEADGRLGFGPSSIRMRVLPRLVASGGKVGYELSLLPGAKTAHPRWKVQTSLGRVLSPSLHVSLESKERRVRTVGAGRRTTFFLAAPSKPDSYFVAAQFKSLTGRPLGYFRLYFRVTRPTLEARLGLWAVYNARGQTVFGRINNYGTAPVLYGAPYRIERFDGVSWSLAPESPDAFILPQYTAFPGESGAECSPFEIPSSMPFGHYRMVKEVSFAGHLDREATIVTAEFNIVP